jgi:hypothetical protein
VDEDHLSPELGRLIDAAKAAAAAAAAAREEAVAQDGARRAEAPVAWAEGWAVLVGDGTVYAGPDVAAVLFAAQAGCPSGGDRELLAAAFAVVGEGGDTLLPGEGDRAIVSAVDPGLPVAVKHLGRWVAMPISELPPA